MTISNTTKLIHEETTLEDLYVELDLGEIYPPNWIDKDTTISDLVNIVHGGCESGAYMPAVTYHLARKTMSEDGDDVLEYIDEYYGLDEYIVKDISSWSHLCCKFLSFAVELYAFNILTKLAENFEDGIEQNLLTSIRRFV